ncbi:MAG: MFS transporter, partial [Planctomycetales bacterium]|nr:MFS transporter [Planctomycetales bacterium]
TVIAKWFSRNRGRAVGIASMGPPTGGLLLSPLVGVMLSSYGWRPTLLVFAVLHAILIPFLWLAI